MFRIPSFAINSCGGHYGRRFIRAPPQSLWSEFFGIPRWCTTVTSPSTTSTPFLLKGVPRAAVEIRLLLHSVRDRLKESPGKLLFGDGC